MKMTTQEAWKYLSKEFLSDGRWYNSEKGLCNAIEVMRNEGLINKETSYELHCHILAFRKSFISKGYYMKPYCWPNNNTGHRCRALFAFDMASNTRIPEQGYGLEQITPSNQQPPNSSDAVIDVAQYESVRHIATNLVPADEPQTSQITPIEEELNNLLRITRSAANRIVNQVTLNEGLRKRMKDKLNNFRFGPLY